MLEALKTTGSVLKWHAGFESWTLLNVWSLCTVYVCVWYSGVARGRSPWARNPRGRAEFQVKKEKYKFIINRKICHSQSRVVGTFSESIIANLQCENMIRGRFWFFACQDILGLEAQSFFCPGLWQPTLRRWFDILKNEQLLCSHNFLQKTFKNHITSKLEFYIFY